MAEYETIRRASAGARTSEIDEGLRAHMNKVYGLMSVAMVITGVISLAMASIASTTDPTQEVAKLGNGVMLTDVGAALYLSAFRWVVLLAPLGMVMFLASRIHKLSMATAQTMFYVYSGLVGVSISSIFLIYTGESVATTFFVTAIAFASLSLYGYTTKRDLSGMGSFLIMGVVGLIVAMIVNIFLQSAAIMFAISTLGVLIFAGLTAYDTQKIKSVYLAHAQGGDQEWLGKSAIMGALNLYLDFLNMFMFLLMFLGNRE
ncbi:MAG: FtsH-binding integral membrane protein [Paracoccaceae bacterium]|jgi:FtsH-binding integral membrane protein